jgi:methyl-accepting chemotaxis protein
LEEAYSSLLAALAAARDGDFSVRLPSSGADDLVDLAASAFNEWVGRSDAMMREVSRVSQVVGREGRTAERVSLGHVGGAWAVGIEALNSMVEEVIWRAQEVARVVNDVSEGDLA